MSAQSTVGMLSAADVLAKLREAAERSRRLEADLLVHLDEILRRNLGPEETSFANALREQILAKNSDSPGSTG